MPTKFSKPHYDQFKEEPINHEHPLEFENSIADADGLNRIISVPEETTNDDSPIRREVLIRLLYVQILLTLCPFDIIYYLCRPKRKKTMLSSFIIAAAVVINELMAANLGTIMSPAINFRIRGTGGMMYN